MNNLIFTLPSYVIVLILVLCIIVNLYIQCRSMQREEELNRRAIRYRRLIGRYRTAELAVFTNTMHLHTLHRQLSDEELSVEDEIDHVRIVNELTKPPSYEEPPSYEMALIIEASNQRNENFNSTE